MKRALFLLSFLSLSSAFGSFDLPKNLNAKDREGVLGVLGFGSKSKVLSSPVPLGGSDGFEVGFSTEYIPVSDIAGLGSGSSEQGELNYHVLTFGKGIVHNVDTFFHFTPIPQSDGVFGYGAHVRWGFWEARRFPALMSFVIHGSGMNYGNVLSTRTTGLDLLMTVALEQAALYFGGGPVRTIGTFSGGTNGLTLEGNNQDADLSDLHTVFGLSMNFEKLSLTLEVDRVVQASYAARMSYRF
ncbi:MAG: hypothetical protein KF789_00340 [Bdellovibrionaceae bacterium]|nr:hypothetical protein [Pseudobdellovibrionaceae bacterium]